MKLLGLSNSLPVGAKLAYASSEKPWFDIDGPNVPFPIAKSQLHEIPPIEKPSEGRDQEIEFLYPSGSLMSSLIDEAHLNT